MPGPHLASRVDRAEQDITALSDTILEIKEVVDQHTETLAEHGQELAEIKQIQAHHGELLNEHSDMLANILTLLGRLVRHAGLPEDDR